MFLMQVAEAVEDTVAVVTEDVVVEFMVKD
jgi:hypothetical protein